MSKQGRKRLDPKHPFAVWLRNNAEGLDSKGIAARLGVSKSTIDSIASRRRRPSVMLALRLMDITGLPIETFCRPLRKPGFSRVNKLRSKLTQETNTQE